MQGPPSEERQGDACKGGSPVATGQTHLLIQHLRRAVARPDEAGSSDGQLLSRYLATRDEAAFEAIVRRHGPMVLGVCRRLLRDRHEVHDAFQATFLVLVRKAASVAPPEMLPNWLHGVARQTAVRARSSAARRRLRERLVAQVPEPEARPADPCDGLRPLLDEELSRLPGNHRVAVILCLLEGKTHAEAARHLGWPVGTLASRLSRGRRMLAKRLARRGVAPSAGVLAALAAQGTAAVPVARITSTVQVGSLYGVGPAGAGAVPVSVVALTEGVLKAMSLKKLKAVTAVLLTAGLFALGGGLLTRTMAADDRPAVPVADKRPSPAPAASPAPGKSKSRLE